MEATGELSIGGLQVEDGKELSYIERSVAVLGAETGN